MALCSANANDVSTGIKSRSDDVATAKMDDLIVVQLITLYLNTYECF